MVKTLDKESINVLKQIIKDELNPINQKLDNMDDKLDRIEKRVNATFEQTAGLSEFRIESNEKFDNVNNDIKDLRAELSYRNITASKNRIDIEKIKNVINSNQ